MIARLRGLVDEKGPDGVVIDVQGVGYKLACSARAIAALPATGGSADLRVETHVREDAITLYGFLDAGERDAFRQLLAVQGVGPKHALAILSVLSPAELAQAAAIEDKAAVSRADGVGPKLAQRVVNELKDKAHRLSGGAASATASAAPGAPIGGDAGVSDAASALLNLGYERGAAFAAAAAARRDLGDGAPVDALIKAALKALSA